MATMDMIIKPSKRRTLFSLLHSCTVENKLKTEILSLGENRYKICAISDIFTKEYIQWSACMRTTSLGSNWYRVPISTLPPLPPVHNKSNYDSPYMQCKMITVMRWLSKLKYLITWYMICIRFIWIKEECQYFEITYHFLIKSNSYFSQLGMCVFFPVP